MRSSRSSWSLSRRTVTQILAVCLGALCALLPLGCTPAGNQNTNTANVNAAPPARASAPEAEGRALATSFEPEEIVNPLDVQIPSGLKGRVTIFVEEDYLPTFDIIVKAYKANGTSAEFLRKPTTKDIVSKPFSAADNYVKFEISTTATNPVYQWPAPFVDGPSTKGSVILLSDGQNRSFTTPIGIISIRAEAP